MHPLRAFFYEKAPLSSVDDDVISLISSDPAASALLGSAQEELKMSEGEEAETEPSQSSCPAYDELLEVMQRATARLDLP